MKYCPVCQTRYDEEIMRFCTKDGTPLIDEEAPNFVEMPSEDVGIERRRRFRRGNRHPPQTRRIGNNQCRTALRRNFAKNGYPDFRTAAGKPTGSRKTGGFVSTAAAAEKNKHVGGRAFDDSRNNCHSRRRTRNLPADERKKFARCQFELESQCQSGHESQHEFKY